ncbi:protein kinase domain-containing protein [Actinomycetospora soli]|uniref:protein kinase domain-containing protein n=1 Tax=Actinomycetospora soli TaxID=2893887 RepID=UPI001E61E4E5|nr:protein kinase [Actinomycetospora soli]MCD2186608.1 protein kinase [Actinomycetospora soli]
MDADSSRWHEITPSAFDHEKRALEHLRGLLPDRQPFQVWTNFTFTSDQGHVREVDALVVCPAGVHLIEIKNFRGRLHNRGSIWMLDGEMGTSRDNPIGLAMQKAKELRSRLRVAARAERVDIPYIGAAIFLAEPGMRCELDEAERHHVYAPNDAVNDLPKLGRDLLLATPGHRAPQPDFFRRVQGLLGKVGIARTRRSVTVGVWEIEPRPFDSGPTWGDHHATRPDIPGDYRRIRIYLYQRQTDQESRESVKNAAYREYQATRAISHPGILAPSEVLEHEMGPALLIEQHRDAMRLDHWVAEHNDALTLPQRLGLIRQLAEAVGYAHERRLVHRALSPRAVIVQPDGRLRVGEWQVAERGRSSTKTAHRVLATSHAGNHVEAAASGYLAPEFTNGADGTVAIDVFGLGAVSYLLLTGKPPATGRIPLMERLATEDGLRPSTDVADLPPALDELVAFATAPRVASRHSDVDEFLAFLAQIEAENSPAVETFDPLDARAGDGLPGGYRVVRPLGSGASSRGFLVERHGHESVLKIGRTAEADEWLVGEAIALDELRHEHVVALRQGMFALGNRSAIELSFAGDRTLAQLLHEDGSPDVETAERLGTQLANALAYVHDHDTFHRDIKPDNVGLQAHARRGLSATLFDFSLAGASTADVLVGTYGYRDPFVGGTDRPTFDRAADLYSLAVTLHEVLTGEMPRWGDDGTDPRFVDEVTLSEEHFPGEHRAALSTFFRTALHRSATSRHRNASHFAQAWREVFHGRPEEPEIEDETAERTARLVVHVDALAEVRRMDRTLQDAVLDAVRSFPRRLPALVPPPGAADPRMRTLSISDTHSGAVLAPASEGDDLFLLLRVLPHDEARSWATKHGVTINGVSGAIELRDVVELDRLEAELEAAAHRAPALLFDSIDDADLERLGIDEQVRGVARSLTNEATLRTLQGYLPEEQFSVLLALAAGRTPDEVWTDIVAPRSAPDPVDPDDVEAAVERTQGKLLRVDDTSLGDYLERPISAWRTFLHPSQERIAYRPSFWGSAQVTGGPGTGKTVAALHRVKYLTQRKPLPPKSILVTTYTNSLEAALERDLRQMDLTLDELEAVQVQNIDSWTRSIVEDALGRAPTIVKPGDSNQRWKRAAQRAGVSESPSFLEAELKNVVLAQRLDDEDAYLSCIRHGRGRPVRRGERRGLWAAMTAYQQGLASDRLWTWAGLADKAAQLLEHRAAPPFQHVVVDEVQDLHPAQLRVLRAACKRGTDDIFLTGDPHQRIWSNRVSLKQVGISVANRSFKLKINYRTSAEILDWALGILGPGEHENFDGTRDSLAEYRASFHGRPPVLVGYDSESAEMDALADAVRGWEKDGVAGEDIAVLGRTRDIRDRARAALDAAGISTRGVTDDATDGRVCCATMHGVKGLEFRAVVLVGVSQDAVPNRFAVTSESQDPTQHEQDLQQERNVLFVAATRAREELRVTWSGEPSRFLGQR